MKIIQNQTILVGFQEKLTKIGWFLRKVGEIWFIFEKS